MAEETTRSPFSVGEYCADLVSLWKFDVERILFAIYDQDQEECSHDSGVLIDDALFGLFGLWLQERSLLGISQHFRGRTRGGAEFHRDLFGHLLRHLAVVEEGLEALCSLPSLRNGPQELAR